MKSLLLTLFGIVAAVSIGQVAAHFIAESFAEAAFNLKEAGVN
jgi:hypothetical protein